jgi:hypothetical protein
MDETVKATIYAALIGVGGLFLGIILSFCLESLRWRYRENKTKQRVRELLGLEIEHNLDELKLFWSELEKANSTIVESYIFGSERVSRLIELRLPVWGYKVWESQMSLLAGALNREEIKRVHLLYKHLNTLTSIRDQIIVIDADRTFVSVSSQPSPLGISMNPKMFVLQREGPKMLVEFEKIVKEIQTNGNPLKDEKIN